MPINADGKQTHFCKCHLHPELIATMKKMVKDGDKPNQLACADCGGLFKFLLNPNK